MLLLLLRVRELNADVDLVVLRARVRARARLRLFITRYSGTPVRGENRSAVRSAGIFLADGATNADAVFAVNEATC